MHSYFLFQMASLASALGSHPNYTKPIKCKVVAISEDLHFQASGQTMTTAGIAEGQISMKATVYPPQMQPDQSVIVKNYTIHNGNMSIKAHTKVYPTGNTLPVDLFICAILVFPGCDYTFT
jgi:hypothetical protein